MGGPDVEQGIEPSDCTALVHAVKDNYASLHVDPGDNKYTSLEENNKYTSLGVDHPSSSDSTETSQGTDSSMETPSYECSQEKENHINCCDDKR